MTGKVINLVKWMLVCVVGLLFYLNLQTVGNWFGLNPVVFKEKFDAEQMNCFVSILINDTKGITPDKVGKAQELVADTVLRYRRLDQSLGFCDIHRNALTLYPRNWERAKTFVGRSSHVTRWNPFNWGTALIEAENRARQALERGLSRDRCATNYVRAKPGYKFGTNELEAQKAIVSTMKLEKSDPQLGMTFYCP